MTEDRRPVRIGSRRFVRSLLGAFAVAPAFLVCSWLYYQSTDLVYGPLSYAQNAALVKTIRWSVFGGLALALVAVIVFLKLSRTNYGNRPFSLLVLLPVIAFCAFSNWIFGILVFSALIAVLVFSQLYAVVIRDELRRPVTGWGKWCDRAATLRFIVLAAAIATGVWLMITSRSWAYRTHQLEEIRINGLLSEPSTLQQIAQGNHKEYILVSLPGVRVDYTADGRFGSGDDSYTLEYGALTDTRLGKQAIRDWPLWVYMPYYYKPGVFPMIFQASRCTVGKDCSANFLAVRDTAIRRHFPDPNYGDPRKAYIARTGQQLVELVPEPELVQSEAVWREKIGFRLFLLLGLQAAYALVHFAELMLLSRRLRQEYPQG